MSADAKLTDYGIDLFLAYSFEIHFPRENTNIDITYKIESVEYRDFIAVCAPLRLLYSITRPFIYKQRFPY